MTELFYPTVLDPRHRRLKEDVKTICQELSACCIDLVGYYALPEDDRWFLSREFANESLWVRTLPDLYIRPERPPGFFLDVKSTANPKWPNLSIELSSFYWTTRRNMPDSRGIKCLHFYAGKDRQNNIRVFSPLLVKVSRIHLTLYHWSKDEKGNSVWIPWTEEQKFLFRHYAECIAPKLIQEYDNSQRKEGSGDPYVLIPQTSVEKHMLLEDFLQNHQARMAYSKQRGTTMTDLSRFACV